jgi:hypothetical protein
MNVTDSDHFVILHEQNDEPKAMLMLITRIREYLFTSAPNKKSWTIATRTIPGQPSCLPWKQVNEYAIILESDTAKKTLLIEKGTMSFVKRKKYCPKNSSLVQFIRLKKSSVLKAYRELMIE